LRSPHDHFDRNQPRVPKGHHGGGQWTDGKERELSKLQLKFAGPLADFFSRLRARPRPSPPMPPPPPPLPPARMAPPELPWERSPPLQPGIPDRPIADEPTKPFDLNRCLDICATGNVSEMEKFCRGHTPEGTAQRALCWRGVSDLEAGDTASCENRCRGIANNNRRKK
jgi:hypothetical protein